MAPTSGAAGHQRRMASARSNRVVTFRAGSWSILCPPSRTPDRDVLAGRARATVRPWKTGGASRRPPVSGEDRAQSAHVANRISVVTAEVLLAPGSGAFA